MPIIQEDPLIRRFARHQVLRKGDNITYNERNQIRSKLRFIGPFISQVRTTTGKAYSLSMLLTPAHYDDCVNAVLELRKKNKQMALTLGHYIKKACYLKLAEGIKSQHEDLKLESKEFLELFASSWSEMISSSTLRMQQLDKINTSVQLPIVEDLDKLVKYLESAITSAIDDAASLDYTHLQKLVICSLILFNKRRPAEVTDITTANYRTSFHNQDDRDEIIATLTPEEKALAGRYLPYGFISCMF